MHHSVLVDAVTNPRQATVLITLGLELQKPGVFILYNKDHPKQSTGGKAHFLFQTNLANAVRQYLRTYEEGHADADLETFLREAKGKSPEIDAFIARLEPVIRDALIVYGRRFIDNYQAVVKSLKSDIAAYVLTGGTPVYDNTGKYAGIQDFSLKGVRRNER
jgi:hypothetical protein